MSVNLLKWGKWAWIMCTDYTPFILFYLKRCKNGVFVWFFYDKDKNEYQSHMNWSKQITVYISYAGDERNETTRVHPYSETYQYISHMYVAEAMSCVFKMYYGYLSDHLYTITKTSFSS